jgi:hypothetical protein
MAYDERLAERLRKIFATLPGASEKKMFGGVCFLVDAKMVCGLAGPDLMARLGPAQTEAALKRPHVRPMDFTGKPMAGYVFVAAAGVRTDAALRGWVDRAVAFVATVPAKKPKRRVTRAAAATRSPGRAGPRSPRGRDGT